MNRLLWPRVGEGSSWAGAGGCLDGGKGRRPGVPEAEPITGLRGGLLGRREREGTKRLEVARHTLFLSLGVLEFPGSLNHSSGPWPPPSQGKSILQGVESKHFPNDTWGGEWVESQRILLGEGDWVGWGGGSPCWSSWESGAQGLLSVLAWGSTL